MPLRPGDAVEHFVIVSSLGEGGMGHVYLARDTRLQRSIALKIMQPEAGGGASGEGASNGAARLLREAQAAAGLEHPNVVTIYEVGEIGGDGEEAGRPFIAMELVKGRSLRAFIGDESVPIKERIRWLGDVARALVAAHRAGLVHRDIKPENVMIRDDGVVKVLDFGLAKRVPTIDRAALTATQNLLRAPATANAAADEALTGKGVAIGTPYYMAPEQMRREVLDGRADQFAWGVVAYELLSGTPAWGRDADALELVAKLLSEDPPPLERARPDIPPHVAATVTRAMAKNRSARFDTMDALLVALFDEGGAYLPTMPRIAVNEPERVVAPRSESPDRKRTTTSVRAPAKRRAITLAGAGIVASVLAVVAGFYARRAVAPRETAAAPETSSAVREAGFPEFGSPMSKSPEATAAYRKGMRALRDADTGGALDELDRAIKLDASFAAAHLRRGLWNIPLWHAGRDHTREAARLREDLGQHDRVLLDAAAPLLEAPENLAETATRLAAAVSRFPSDADFALMLCRARQATGELKEAREVCQRAKDLDPTAAAPIKEIAVVLARLGDVPGALASFDECLRASPLATSCLEPLWQLQTFEGRCADALATARRIVSIHPESADAYDHLAVALAGAGESIESVRLALAQKAEHVPGDEATFTQLRDAAMVALMTGDFARADASLRAWDDAEAGRRFEGDHMAVSCARIQLAEEEGKTKEATSLVTTYLKQRPAWTLATEGDYSIFFVSQLYALGALPRADFVDKRDRWVAGEKARGSSERFPWVDGYAVPAVSEADALEALGALPGFLPLPGPLDRTPEWEGPIGNVYRLAGRDAEALPHLTHAARSCALLSSPFEVMAATLELGLSLEHLGQRTGACDAYRSVVRRWGSAKGSRTAASAREGLKRLACGP